MNYLLLVVGLAVLLGTHSISIVAPAWRERMVAGIGVNAWKAIFGVVSIVGIVLTVKGFAMARLDPVQVWLPPVWLRHLAAILVLPVFPLLLSTYLPGRIQAAAQHPTLLATKLWATAHLLANGRLADILLFGAFLAWAVADRISLKQRAPRAIQRLPESRYNDLIVVVLGFAIYVFFVSWAHFRLFGVYPMHD